MDAHQSSFRTGGATFTAAKLIATAALLAPVMVFAAPVTFRFNMPAFQGAGALTAQTSILDVTVDNGGASILGQTYLNTDITFYSVNVPSLSLANSGAITFANGSTAYITTDLLGVPTLDLSIDLDTSAIAQFSGGFIQLGTRDGSGPTQYAISLSGFTANGIYARDFVVVGSVVGSAPEPGVAALLGASLVAFGLTRRRIARLPIAG